MSAPYWTDGQVTLYHGDCRVVTEWLSADVLVTDPPYGRDWRQGTIRVPGRESEGHDGIASDGDTGVRDAVLALWAGRPAIAFGDLMLAPPACTKQVLLYRKAPDAGVRGATAGFRRDAEAIYLIGKWRSAHSAAGAASSRPVPAPALRSCLGATATRTPSRWT